MYKLQIPTHRTEIVAIIGMVELMYDKRQYWGVESCMMNQLDEVLKLL